MSLLAIILVVVSAFLHAGWNLLSKSNTASGPAFFLLSATAAALLLSPFLVWYCNTVGLAVMPTKFWYLLVISGIAQMIYLLGLGFAYKQADIGVVYPIARALPVLMVGVVTVLLGYSLTAYAWFGFLLITIGCLFVPLESFSQLNVRNYAHLGVVWAVIAAIGTAGYSVVDKEALLILDQTFHSQVSDVSSAIFYLGLQFWSISLCFVIYLTLSKSWVDIVEAWQIRRSTTIAGIMMSTTYGLVLLAMTMTENVSYVVALRQLSIVIGMVLGVVFLFERLLLTRVVGSVMILLGLVLVALR
ncbi:multidrug transporter [Vibrio hepatarius]|jgi:phosphonate utilization associated putative membrane protein|uniref:EamA family transporter n=1 Tax=Vibrio hepatarius TaxID=171383 RepID=UPI002FD8CFB9